MNLLIRGTGYFFKIDLGLHLALVYYRLGDILIGESQQLHGWTSKIVKTLLWWERSILLACFCHMHLRWLITSLNFVTLTRIIWNNLNIIIANFFLINDISTTTISEVECLFFFYIIHFICGYWTVLCLIFMDVARRFCFEFVFSRLVYAKLYFWLFLKRGFSPNINLKIITVLLNFILLAIFWVGGGLVEDGWARIFLIRLQTLTLTTYDRFVKIRN